MRIIAGYTRIFSLANAHNAAYAPHITAFADICRLVLRARGINMENGILFLVHFIPTFNYILSLVPIVRQLSKWIQCHLASFVRDARYIIYRGETFPFKINATQIVARIYYFFVSLVFIIRQDRRNTVYFSVCEISVEKRNYPNCWIFIAALR